MSTTQGAETMSEHIHHGTEYRLIAVAPSGAEHTYTGREVARVMAALPIGSQIDLEQNLTAPGGDGWVWVLRPVEDEDEDYYPPMADKPCDQPQLCATYHRGWCTECGYPSNCHDY